MSVTLRRFLLPATFFAFLMGIALLNSQAAEESPDAAVEVDDATEESDILKDRDLLRFVGFWRSLSDEERERLHEKLQDPDVRKEIRSIVEDPERLSALRSHRPELFKRFEKQWELEREYWELLKKYHDATEDSVRKELKDQIRTSLTQLVDAETARRKAELQHLEKWIEWLKERLQKFVEHRAEYIKRRLEQDLEKLPPAPRPPRMRRSGPPGPGGPPGPDGPSDADGRGRWRDRDDGRAGRPGWRDRGDRPERNPE